MPLWNVPVLLVRFRGIALGVLQRIRAVGAGTLVVAVASFVPHASGADDGAFARLLKVKSLKCKLTTGVYADWKSGGPRITPDKSGVEYHFDSIDLSKNSARLIANVGAGDVRAFATPGGISFVEWPPLGNPVTTNVFPFLANDGGFIAVSSRHTASGISGMALPSQYHGSCAKWE